MSLFMQNILFIGLGGAFAQWIAWYFRLPSIIILLLFGVLLGPVFGLIDPKNIFGDQFTTIISFAVAIILFEGGLSLRFKEIKHLFSKLLRISLIGGLLFFLIVLAVSIWLGVLPIQAALVFSAVMIVTGPTVIIPLLRQARINKKTATLLKWEGIINDSIGALLAVMVFEIYIVFNHAVPGELGGFIISFLFSTIIAGLIFGLFAGQIIALIFRRSLVPEYLKSPILFMMVLACFTFANSMQDEAGLLAVTLMGISMANSKLPAYEDIRHFKENISVLLISSLFLMLAGSFDLQLFFSINIYHVIFIALVIFVIRPVAINIATLGTKMTIGERFYIGFIAPRGIVAIAVCGLFAEKLIEHDFPGSEQLLLLSYLLVIVTVILHGFTAAPLAKRLGLSKTSGPGMLLIGANAFTKGFAKLLQENEIKVTVADVSYNSLRKFRLDGIETYYGEILSDNAEHVLDLNEYSKVLSLRGNDAYNSLVCRNMGPKIGRNNVFQINSSPTKGNEKTQDEEKNITKYGQVFLPNGINLEQLLMLVLSKYKFGTSKITEKHDNEDFYQRVRKSGYVLCVLRKNELIVPNLGELIDLEIDDKVFHFLPPVDEKTTSQ